MGRIAKLNNTKLSISKIGEKNPMWKGDNVGFAALHEWVTSRMTTERVCRACGSADNIDLANISQKYLRELSDWEWLCRKCHMKTDGRSARIGKSRIGSFKLSQEQVAEIQSMPRMDYSGVTYFAEKFKCSRATVHKAWNGDYRKEHCSFLTEEEMEREDGNSN